MVTFNGEKAKKEVKPDSIFGREFLKGIHVSDHKKSLGEG